MKKIILSIACILAIFTMTACGSKNIEGTLEEIMDKVYVNVPDDQKPMMLTNTEITDDNIEGYIGTKDIEYKEGLVSESGVGSIAHSVVLIRLKDAKDAEDVKAKIEKNANPRKWICVEAENVNVYTKGDLVILIMTDNEKADELKEGFNSL